MDARLTRALRNPWLLGAAGTLLAWLNIGVDIAGPDQQLYIPYVRHFAHPDLYARDWIFDSDNYRATLWVPLVGTLHRLVGGDLEPLLLVVHALSLFVLFSGLAATTARVTRGAAPAWVVAFLSWPPPVPGAAAAIWEPSPHPRTLAVGLALWTMRFAVEGQARPAALFAAAATLIHPLLGAAALLGAALALADNRRPLLEFVAMTALLLGGARLLWPTQRTELPLAPVEWWLAAATATFLWFNKWGPAVWLTLGAWIALFTAGAWTARDLATTRLMRFGLAGLPLLAVALVGMLLRSPLLVALQLHRGQYVFVVAALILIARRLEGDVEQGRLPSSLYVVVATLPWTHSLMFPMAGLAVALAYARLPRLPAWLAHAVAAVMLLAVALRFRPHRLQAPRDDDDWIALQHWAATTTPPSTTFLAPYHVPDFRVFSARSVVVGAQDEQPAIFNRALAETWQQRRHALDGFATHDCAALLAAARRFDAADVVTEFDCPLPLVHRQGRFRVYGSAKMTP